MTIYPYIDAITLLHATKTDGFHYTTYTSTKKPNWNKWIMNNKQPILKNKKSINNWNSSHILLTARFYSALKLIVSFGTISHCGIASIFYTLGREDISVELTSTLVQNSYNFDLWSFCWECSQSLVSFSKSTDLCW